MTATRERREWSSRRMTATRERREWSSRRMTERRRPVLSEVEVSRTADSAESPTG